MKNKVLSTLKEIAIVLIGVVMALIINDWKDKRNNINYMDATDRKNKIKFAVFLTNVIDTEMALLEFYKKFSEMTLLHDKG